MGRLVVGGRPSPRAVLVSGAVVLLALLPSVAAASVADASTAPKPRPDLVISSVTTARTVTAGDAVRIRVTTRNAGRTKAGRTTTRFALSPDRTPSASDRTLGSRPVGPLAGGARSTGTRRVSVPAATAAGTYYVVACADDTRAVRETHERNNCRATTAVTVAAATPPHPPGDPDAGPDQAGRDALVAAAGPWNLLRSPPLTSTRTDPPVYEPVRAVSRTISPDTGGQVTVIDRAGDHLTLSIPPHAVLHDTVVTATPVVSTPGATAVGAHPIGVRLEPSGLGLLEQATLTIVPADGVTARKVEGVIATSDGSHVTPEIVGLDTGSLTVPVNHFTMVAVVVPDGSGGTTTRYFTQAEYAQSLRNAIVEAMERSRNASIDTGLGPDVTQTILAASDLFWDNVVEPILQRSATDCAFARDNLITAVTAARNDQLLGLDRPSLNPGLAAALSNCWEEETATCMTMAPGRFVTLLATLRQLQLLGVTPPAHTPQNYDEVGWCGTANGFVSIIRSQDQPLFEGEVAEETRATIWVSARGLISWNSDGTFSVGVVSDDPTTSASDIVGDFSSHLTYPGADGETCTSDWEAHHVLSGAPTAANLARTDFSASTGVATTAQGLVVGSFPVPVPVLETTRTGSDSCPDTAGQLDATFDWSRALTDADQPYVLTADAIRGSLRTTWDNTVTRPSITTRVRIDADIHLAGLTDFLEAGPPA